MVSPYDPKRPFILLTPSEADQVRDLGPAELEPGYFIISDSALMRPDFAKHIPFLQRLPRCSLDSQNRIRHKSIRTADNIPKPQVSKSVDGNDWGKRMLPARGDWSAARLHQCVGGALSAWEDFEAEFANLFLAVVSPNIYSLPVLRAFGSVVTFNGRLDMVKAAAQAKFAFLSSPHERRFDLAIKRAERLAPRRNEIAHGSVSIFAVHPNKAKGLALMPGEHARRHREIRSEANLAGVEDLIRDDPPHIKWSEISDSDRTTPAYAYTSLEVSYFKKQFVSLAKETAAVAELLWIRRHQVLLVTPGPLRQRTVRRRRPLFRSGRK